ncbi:mediator complex subunit 6 [Brevipalpus obovatus]|uniref:mediator complex subunit 6 n=1 Tax=Brevipalpus obovatus TaxID=246614 RepID=UPI003D9DC1E7
MNDLKENPLYISWHDSTWIPQINPNTVLDYFGEKSNPFYDRTCNNEMLKMQKQSLDLLETLTGIEFILLHVQEPILYIIRKQHRHSPTQVTPLADYYVLAGYVYQAPDLNSVINSRVTTALHHLSTAFDEVHSFARYHSSKGYSWDFGKSFESKEKEKDADPERYKREEASSSFQRARVDNLISNLIREFPPNSPKKS